MKTSISQYLLPFLYTSKNESFHGTTWSAEITLDLQWLISVSDRINKSHLRSGIPRPQRRSMLTAEDAQFAF